ncbi:hypothetical protein KIW84_025020 [Lathyrus oleraceus]|uniref:Uncharacterized protein n=1 Tax=Pisum sativum TaxID=3888 RepID=A0A9D5BD90_PEA|nr:hypothetical protein KIW84_025020 [Pisum sativum]
MQIKGVYKQAVNRLVIGIQDQMEERSMSTKVGRSPQAEMLIEIIGRRVEQHPKDPKENNCQEGKKSENDMIDKQMGDETVPTGINLSSVVATVGDIAWKDAKYGQIWEYLRDEFELTQRFASLDFKLKFKAMFSTFPPVTVADILSSDSSSINSSVPPTLEHSDENGVVSTDIPIYNGLHEKSNNGLTVESEELPPFSYVPYSKPDSAATMRPENSFFARGIHCTDNSSKRDRDKDHVVKVIGKKMKTFDSRFTWLSLKAPDVTITKLLTIMYSQVPWES